MASVVSNLGIRTIIYSTRLRILMLVLLDYRLV